MTERTAEVRLSMEAVRHRIRLCCIWAWVPAIVLFGVGFVLIAGMVPPTGESWTSNRVVEFYGENRNAIRVGLILSMFATALLLPVYSAISEQLRQIEGQGSMLAPIQWGGAVILVAFFQIICLLWLLASFRTDTDPDVVRAATDYGWLVWTILIPTLSLQWICMAIATFVDPREDAVWPRWAGYVFIWVALTNAGGICAVFLKTGPFSWNGLIGWWLPTISFALVMTMNMWLMRNHAIRERALAVSRVRPLAEPDVISARPGSLHTSA